MHRIKKVCQKKLENPLKIILNGLFSHNFRLVYKMTSDQILSFYEQVMEGKKIVSKPYVSTMPQSYLFGLPMSSEILAEIICNGLSSEDTKVRKTKIKEIF